MRVRGCAGCGCAARVCGRVCGSGATGQRDDLWRPYLEGGNLSQTDSETLWEARLKVGEGEMESWNKTVARFQHPNRSLNQCQAPVRKLQPEPNDRTSNVPGCSWETRLRKLSAIGDRRPATAPPLDAPPLKPSCRPAAKRS